MSYKKIKFNISNQIIALVVIELLFWGLFFLSILLLRDLLPGFRLQNPQMLHLLYIIPIMIVIYIIRLTIANKRLNLFASDALLYNLIPDFSASKSLLRFILFHIAVAFFIVGLANPQIGSKIAEGKQEGVDIIIALDVSNSMVAEDLKPNRLQRAKLSIEKLVNRLGGDRVGIIVFAGNAYVQLPITTDYSAAKLFLNNIDNTIVPVQGTAIGKAIDLAMESFNFEDQSSKTIIILTDGENHEDDAIKAAEVAYDQGVIINTIGMGSVQGAPIPVYSNGRQIDFKKDKSGETIITKLNDKMLKDISEAGGGTFVRASQQDVGLGILLDNLDQMEKKEFGSVIYTEYESRFQYFIGLGLLLLLIDLLLFDKKQKWKDLIVKSDY
jgi:Ca-activated chloride channel family protein